MYQDEICFVSPLIVVARAKSGGLIEEGGTVIPFVINEVIWPHAPGAQHNVGAHIGVARVSLVLRVELTESAKYIFSYSACAIRSCGFSSVF